MKANIQASMTRGLQIAVNPLGYHPKWGVNSSTKIMEQAWMQIGQSLYQAIAELEAKESLQQRSNEK